MSVEPTLGAKLGMTVHLSPLLQKARRLGLGSKELQTLAVQRGCRHYRDGTEPREPLVSTEDFSNEELGIALLSPALRYEPHGLRCGAAMLGADGNDPVRLARMAVMERCVPSVRHVAQCGKHFEPDNRFWSRLLDGLPSGKPPRPGVLPHRTRFVTMTGITRGRRGLVVNWQRPRRAGSLQKQPAGHGSI